MKLFVVLSVLSSFYHFVNVHFLITMALGYFLDVLQCTLHLSTALAFKFRLSVLSDNAKHSVQTDTCFIQNASVETSR